MRFFALALLLLAGLPGSARWQPALAHAALVLSEPADGAVLKASPATVRLRFNEPVAPAVLRLIDSRGGDRPVTVEAHDDLVVVGLPPDLPHGTHTVSYRVISADGHPVGGSLLFSVGRPSGAAQGVQTGSPLRSALIWVARIGVYAGLMLGCGGVFFHGWLGRDLERDRVARLALLAGVVSAPAALGLQGLDALDLPLIALAMPQPWRVASGTSLGWSVALALLAVACALLAEQARTLTSRQKLAAIALFGAGLSLTVTGHASNASPQWLTRPAVMLHVMAAAFWTGALPPLLSLVRRRDPGLRRILARFSGAALVVVSLLAAAGTLLAIVQLREVSELYLSAYGRILLAKLLAVFGLLLLAAWNRSRLTPALAGGDAGAACTLGRSIRAEIVLMAMVLGLVGLWRFTPPPRSTLAAAPGTVVRLHIHQKKAMADLQLRPGRAGANDLRLDILRGDFSALQPLEVSVSLDQPDAGIEPIERKAVRLADGSWELEGLQIPFAGSWRIRVAILVTDFEQVELSDTLVVR